MSQVASGRVSRSETRQEAEAECSIANQAVRADLWVSTLVGEPLARDSCESLVRRLQLLVRLVELRVAPYTPSECTQ